MSYGTNKTFGIEQVLIRPGDVFDFESFFDDSDDDNLIEGFLVYKRRSDNNSIIFSMRQSEYFTVKGKAGRYANWEKIDYNNRLQFTSENLNVITEDGINFVDSFTVLTGSIGNYKHYPNLDINQPILGVGLDWMESSIEKKKRELQLEEENKILKRSLQIQMQNEHNRFQEIKKLKEEVTLAKISKILEEEKEQAINENSYESLTRHFLTLNQNLFAYALKTSKK
jgi:hypothetical protein